MDCSPNGNTVPIVSIKLTKKEAVDLISNLTGLLANTTTSLVDLKAKDEKDRFVSYDSRDIGWAKFFGVGRPGIQQIGPIYFM